MKISYFIRKSNGNILAITDKGNFEIAKDADNSLPYGICFPHEDIFKPIYKGIGKSKYDEIMGYINSNKKIPVFSEHYFSPQENNTNFCSKCNQYLTHESHKRESNIHPLFEKIITSFK